MPIGVLTGFAIPTLLTVNLGDHTYVESSDGRKWRCFGRATGGTPICSAQGNVDQADCLAQPDEQSGIRYGITGVCHQAANRILYPAGITVSAARLSRASYARFGVYGRNRSTNNHYSPAHDPWPELAICYSHTHP